MMIDWGMTGLEVEQESFRQIEEEMGAHEFCAEEWRVVRRMIHTCANFAVAEKVHFAGAPVNACLEALSDGVPLYSDSNMIRSGLSVARMAQLNPGYKRDSIHCYVADEEVARKAKEEGITRSLAALEKARPVIDGGIVLIGNAPLALAGIARMIKEDGVRPRLVIGMPVGFVHVEESKDMIMECDVPQVVLKGRMGGSPLAVAALHGMIESMTD